MLNVAIVNQNVVIGIYVINVMLKLVDQILMDGVDNHIYCVGLEKKFQNIQKCTEKGINDGESI